MLSTQVARTQSPDCCWQLPGALTHQSIGLARGGGTGQWVPALGCLQPQPPTGTPIHQARPSRTPRPAHPAHEPRAHPAGSAGQPVLCSRGARLPRTNLGGVASPDGRGTQALLASRGPELAPRRRCREPLHTHGGRGPRCPPLPGPECGGPLLCPHALKTTRPLPTPRPSRQSGLGTEQWAWTFARPVLSPCSPQKVLELDVACISPAFPSGRSLPKQSQHPPSRSSPTSRRTPFPAAPACGPWAAPFSSRLAQVCPLLPTHLHGVRQQGATVSCPERTVHAAPSCDLAQLSLPFRKGSDSPLGARTGWQMVA